MKERDISMQDMWSKIAASYGKAYDLEEKQRNLLLEYTWWKEKRILELACWNGKILEKIASHSPKQVLWGVDYNPDMVKKAQESVPSAKIIQWDITDMSSFLQGKTFDVIYCVNSLHNLPSKQLIYNCFRNIWDYLETDWMCIFDIRNAYNPFISYGYYKNRKKGLSFWTLSYHRVLRIVKKQWFRVEKIYPIHYENRKESFFDSRFQIVNFLYTLYIKCTSLRIFSPYIFIVIKKK